VSLPYKYNVQEPVVEVFSAASKRHREKLIIIFRSIADNPFLLGEYRQKDATGRDCEVKRFGIWSVTFHSDHSVSRVDIVDVEMLQ